ncbi:MAG: hypothetical protein NVSMB13_04850 [Mycobacteriales bacterium]
MSTLVVSGPPRLPAPLAAWSSARPARRALRVARVAALGRSFTLPVIVMAASTVTFLVGLLLVAVVPMAWGGKSLVVVSGSMEPTLRVGDVVVVSPVSPGSLRPGDIATFRSPDGAARLVTHRVRALTIQGDVVSVVTKGDANNNVESWSMPAAGSVGRVVEHLPALGLLLVRMHTPLLRVGLLAFAFVLVAAMVLQWAYDGARLDREVDRAAS